MTRTTKIQLPHPMPPAFAKEFAYLMTGFDEVSGVGRYIIGHILETSWTSPQAVSPIRVYHRLASGDIPSAAKVRAATAKVPELQKDMRKVVRVLSKLAEDIPAEDLDAIRELSQTRWLEAIKNLSAGREPISSKLASLLATYGVFSAEDDFDSNDPEGTGQVFAYSAGDVMAGPRGLQVYSMGARGMPAGLMSMLMASMGAGGMAEMGETHLGTGASREPGDGSRKISSVDPTKPNLQVFRQADVVSLVQRMPVSMSPNEGNSQQRRMLEAMANEDGLRALTEVPDGDPLAELYGRFPHFKDVLDMVKKSLALAACGTDGKPVRIPPILLRGGPGTGKTYFSQELARVLALHFVERDLSVTSEAFVISGQDPGWKNSKPGVVFDAVVNSKTANPLILLNEVDKAQVTGTHNSPLAALYALLELTSAEQFTDEFIPVRVNMSHVVWLLTANEGFIPDPIVDRLEVFDIRMPTREECRAIAASVWTSICKRYLPRGHGFCEELGEPLLDLVSTFNPRNMRKALTDAAGSAALAERKYLTLEDISAGHKRYAPKTKATIGFTAAAPAA